MTYQIYIIPRRATQSMMQQFGANNTSSSKIVHSEYNTVHIGNIKSVTFDVILDDLSEFNEEHCERSLNGWYMHSSSKGRAHFILLCYNKTNKSLYGYMTLVVRKDALYIDGVCSKSRSGAGTYLFKTAVKLAQALGKQKMELASLTSAISFWKKQGFFHVKKPNGEHKGSGAVGWKMVLYLRNLNLNYSVNAEFVFVQHSGGNALKSNTILNFDSNYEYHNKKSYTQYKKQNPPEGKMKAKLNLKRSQSNVQSNMSTKPNKNTNFKLTNANISYLMKD